MAKCKALAGSAVKGLTDLEKILRAISNFIYAKYLVQYNR